jgi:amino acid transporter
MENSDVKEFPQVTSAVTKDVGDVENAGARNHTKRGLSSRQIQFLALGTSTATSNLPQD